MPRNTSCQNCELHVGARSVCVWGTGRRWSSEPNGAPPKVLVLGEAPGYQEDVRGHPFVGASGNLLDTAMRTVGVEWAYLTNAVRCFPDGALPKKSVGACAPYLDEELAEIKPQYVLALGATAFHRMGGVGSITEQAGKEFWSEKYNCWIMPALHPAAILRAPGRTDSWMADLGHFAALTKNGQAALPPLVVHLVTQS